MVKTTGVFWGCLFSSLGSGFLNSFVSPLGIWSFPMAQSSLGPIYTMFHFYSYLHVLNSRSKKKTGLSTESVLLSFLLSIDLRKKNWGMHQHSTPTYTPRRISKLYINPLPSIPIYHRLGPCARLHSQNKLIRRSKPQLRDLDRDEQMRMWAALNVTIFEVWKSPYFHFFKGRRRRRFEDECDTGKITGRQVDLLSKAWKKKI